MVHSKSIPFILGVSGLIDLEPSDLDSIEIKVRRELHSLASKCRDDLIVCSGLARGSDQLVSRIALEIGLPIMAIFPMKQSEYRNDFLDEQTSLAQFDMLMQKCCEIIELEFPLFTDPDIISPRDQAYRNQGLSLVEKSSSVLALWDGVPFKRGGCGTSLVVEACKGTRLEDSFKCSNSTKTLNVLAVRRAGACVK
jgi:hypothetical protein